MAKAKTPTAKVSKAKTAKTVKKPLDVISAKQYGRNVVLIVEGEKYSRSFPDKVVRDAVMASVVKYNTKPTKKLQTQLLSTMLELEKAKEKKEGKVKEAVKTLKKTKKAKKPEPVTSTEEEIRKAKELLINNNYVISKSAPRRSGEY